MASFFDNVKEFFGGKEQAPAAPAPLDMTTPTGEDATPETAADDAPSTAQTEFSLTNTAQNTLKHLLASAKITRLGHDVPVGYPVEKVEFGEGFGEVGAILVDGAAEAVQHGKSVEMRVTLTNPANDYDLLALQNALPALLNTIPAFQGKIKAKEAHAEPQTYADVEKEFDALLAAKSGVFTPAEHAVVKKFFEAHKGQGDRVEYWSGIEANHDEGAVLVNINAKELPEDKDAVVSSDAQIVTFFEAHKAQILEHVKKHAEALHIEGVTAKALEHIDMHVAAKGWNISVKLATKPAKLTDEAGQPLTGEAYAKAMTETALAKIDTKVLGKLFTESMIEAQHEHLQPIMARILNGHMLKEILEKRLPGDAQVAEFVGKHDLFKDEADLKTEEVKTAQQHMVVVKEPRIGKSSDGKQDEVSVSFELPLGMTLQQVLANIVNPNARETPGTTVSEPAKIGITAPPANTNEVAGGRAA